MALAAAYVATARSPALVASEALSPQLEIFYNARLAMRQSQPTEVLKLWLLHNSVHHHLGEENKRTTAAFRSVVWAALGQLGLCQDGFLKDDDDAGLWPLAMHNYLVASISRGDPPDREPPFAAFEVGRQQRFVSLFDVLSLPELKSVVFTRTGCYWPRIAHFHMSGSPFANLKDRYLAARLLRQLLTTALGTAKPHLVRGLSVVQARIFDLDLALTQLQRSQVRRQAVQTKQRARSLGVSEPASQEVLAQASAWPPNSPEAAFLRTCLNWTANEWLALSRERRLFLFAQAHSVASPEQDLEPVILNIIDALIADGQGDEVPAWVAHLNADEKPNARALVFAGDRGKRLLQIEADSGFRERATIALHRGVAFLEGNQLQDALRAFAYAMANADDSAAAILNMNLARRWLAFVMSRYETTQEVIATLQALVPQQEWNLLAEELIWKAALRADSPSFERAVATVRRGGALDERISNLRVLAEGQPRVLLQRLQVRVATEPHLVLRFTGHLLAHIEAEDKDVRQAHINTLTLQVGMLEALAADPTLRKANLSAVQEQLLRARAILAGLGVEDTSTAGKARGLAVEKHTFAGNVRLAPTDPLPWPFVLPEVRAPSAFAPMRLEPVEWRNHRGQLVFGWSVRE